MRHYQRIAALVLLLFCFVALGCTKKVVVPSEVMADYTYAQALKFFNDNLESFNYYLEHASLGTQVAVLQNVDPVIQETNTALDHWGKALNDQTRRQAYLDLERQMVRLFIKYAVPVIGDRGGE